ncbi:MAG: spore coat protein U domain-containing protein [Rickettsiaceae bacterium]|nr:spore coat protein U domain-containing protein [Rickettsiaceae bacterium]
MSLVNIHIQNYKTKELINVGLWDYFFKIRKLPKVIKKQHVYKVYTKIFAIKTLLILLSSTVVYASGSGNPGDKGYNCNLTTYNIDFGTFYPYDVTFTSTIGTVQVTCKANTGNTTVVYTVSFNAGNSGSYSQRLAYNGVKTIAYNLYNDNSFTQILGTGSNNTYTFSNTYKLAGNQSQTDSFPIYGKVPVQPLAVPGFVYVDTITVTLDY